MCVWGGGGGGGGGGGVQSQTSECVRNVPELQCQREFLIQVSVGCTVRRLYIETKHFEASCNKP